MSAGTPIRIGVTMGDPRGIGPEVIRAAIQGLLPRVDHVTWALYGTPEAFRDTPGEVHKATGKRPERDAIERAAADLRDGTIDAVVTGPVSKSCFEGDFPGHTELFQARLNVERVAMMMTGPRLRVVPVTTHIALRDVAQHLTEDNIVGAARLAWKALIEQLRLPKPTMALAGLNPHAGDGGLFGDEEDRILAPALARLHAEGIAISGPHSPDTVFYQAAQGRYDLVLSGYHDQALIPFKMLHFADGVNVTLGLPRPRTSPDHGPAYDIAGQGVADPTSTRRAIELACLLAGAPVLSGGPN
jgi:4-hydroxythreonine-4-phosphate dehydrogenase